MPYIKTTTTVNITEKMNDELVKKLGEAITLIPGKSEEWLMLATDDGSKMAFRGKSDCDVCMMEVDIFGSTTSEAYNALTERLCEVAEEVLGVAKDKVYVKYREYDRWGYNGFNF